MKSIISITLLLLSSSLFAQLSVNTVKVYDIKPDWATCSFTVQGNNPIDQKGVTWSQSHNPTINYYKAQAPATPKNNCAATFSGLKPSTLYYVRAYVMKQNGEVIYANELSFTTTAKPTEDKNTNQNTGKKVESKQGNTK